MTQINRIGVIGAGNMGSGIAQKIAQEGIDVVMVDVEEKFVKKGVDTIKSLLDKGVERGVFSEEKVDDILSRIYGTMDMEAVKDCDLVIEAVFEDKAVKEELFKKLDSICNKETILATNTSSFYVKDFARVTSRPDRFVGLHYFYHPAMNRLLEVIPCDDTSEETVEKAILAAKLHAKTPIVVKDAPGFAVNRFFVPFLNEAARMLADGTADIPTIEESAKKAFRIGMGPFTLMNVTGIPIAVHSATTLGRELGPFYAPCKTLVDQMEKKQDWDIQGEPDESKTDTVIDRFYGVCCGVAAALVDEGVATIEDTDRGAKIGLRWAQGPFEIMNRIGIDQTHEAVQKICDLYPDFTMPKIIQTHKATGQKFEFIVVDLAVKNRLAYITINRPEAMNALNEAVVAQLGQRMDEALADDGADAIVLQGAGKAFVAGADIGFFIKKIKQNKVQEIVDFTRKGHDVYMKIENAAKPTIVFLDGLSMGGGSELALAAQAILATDQGSMAFPETGIGIYPGLGGMLRLAKQAGVELAKHYTFTGAPLTARDLFDLGIVTKIISFVDLEKEIKALLPSGLPDKYRSREIPEKFEKLARTCAGENVEKLLKGEELDGVRPEMAARSVKSVGYKAPLAVKAANDIIDAQAGADIPSAVEIELSRLAEIFSTSDCLEGLTSAGRKKPEFKGE